MAIHVVDTRNIGVGTPCGSGSGMVRVILTAPSILKGYSHSHVEYRIGRMITSGAVSPF